MNTLSFMPNLAFSSKTLLTVATVLAILGTAAQAETFTTSGRRPMLEVVQALQKEYGWRISYEDPALEYTGDLEDLTSPAYKATHTDPRDVLLVPLAKPFTFSWTSSAQTPDARSVMEQCVAQHNGSGNPGAFRVYYQGDALHVIPLAAKNAGGAMVPAVSALDSIVSFPAQQRTLIDTISLILNLVHRTSGVQAVVGMAAGNAMTKPISIAANGISARDALLLALDAYQAANLEAGLPWHPMTWALLYHADQKMYYLNLFTVRPAPPPSFNLIFPGN
jgi:hypothetical protein